MKRVITLLLAALLLLCGCTARRSAQPSTAPQDTALVPAGTTSGRETEPPGPAPSIAELEGIELPETSLLTPMPLTATEYLDLREGLFLVRPDWSGVYSYGQASFTLRLYSQEELDPDAIQMEAELPDGADLRLEVQQTHFDGVAFGRNARSADDAGLADLDFTYNQYLCTLGFDWALLGKLTQADRLLYEKGDREGQTKLGKAFTALYGPWRDAYYALEPSELPHFYLYSLQISIRTPSDALLEELLLRVEEAACRIPVGRVELRAEAPAEGGEWGDALIGGMTVQAARCDSYYPRGFDLMSPPFVLTAGTDLTILGIRCLDADTTLTRIHAILTDAAGMQTDFQWDGQSPFDLPAGATLNLELGFQNPRLLQNGADFSTELLVDYRSGGKRYSAAIFSFACIWSRPPLEHWLEHMEGVDFEVYYRDYYRFSNPYDRGEGLE